METSGNKRIRVGVVGAGRRAKLYAIRNSSWT